MQKQLAFFSTQKGDEDTFKILISSLKRNYRIYFFNYQSYLNLKKKINYKINKKLFIFKKFNKIIKKSELILTGSSKQTFEKNIWLLSKKLKKKSLCIVDSWVNFEHRFNRKSYR